MKNRCAAASAMIAVFFCSCNSQPQEAVTSANPEHETSHISCDKIDPNGNQAEGLRDQYIQSCATELSKTVRPVYSLNRDDWVGQFIATYYFLADEKDYSHEKRNIPIDGVDGKPLTMISSEFADYIAGGLLKLLDGRILNSSEHGWYVSSSQTGMGVGSCHLLPWHTISVDPKIIPLGTVVQIDETMGVNLPNGTSSNGLWRAEDRGDDIVDNHVELFVGEGEAGGKWFEHSGLYLKPLTIRYIGTPHRSCATDPEALR